MRTIWRLIFLVVAVAGPLDLSASWVGQEGAESPATEKEVHLSNVKALTNGGENAEAYFSFDGADLIFQSTRDGHGCDQIYTMKTDGSDLRRISTGEGRTTCSFFYPDKRHVLYASTHLGGKTCPAKPDFSRGYVWPVYDTYDIFRANPDGSDLTRLTTTPGYDAEATMVATAASYSQAFATATWRSTR